MRSSDWSSDVCSSDLIAGGAEGIVSPGGEKHRPLQDKPFALIGDAEAVEQPLERVACEEDLKVSLLRAGAIEKPRADRGTDVANHTRHRRPSLPHRAACPHRPPPRAPTPPADPAPPLLFPDPPRTPHALRPAPPSF